MERIKKFESFVLSQDFTLDKTTINFIEGKISEDKFIEYLDSDVLNEGIVDSLKGFYVKFKEKAFDVLMTFIKKASKIGFAIFDKMKKFVNWIIDSLSKWKKENPKEYKVIIITLIIVILLIASASTAHAQTTGSPVSVAHMDVAIGYLKELKNTGAYTSGEDNWLKSMAYLIDLRDGTLSTPLADFGDQAVTSAKEAIKIAGKMIDEGLITKNKALMDKCLSLMDVGSEYVRVIWTKSRSLLGTGSKENIRLVVR
jgi:hypothetical protein